MKTVEFHFTSYLGYPRLSDSLIIHKINAFKVIFIIRTPVTLHLGPILLQYVLISFICKRPYFQTKNSFWSPLVTYFGVYFSTHGKRPRKKKRSTQIVLNPTILQASFNNHSRNCLIETAQLSRTGILPNLHETHVTLIPNWIRTPLQRKNRGQSWLWNNAIHI